jgi:hypothetical protein
VTVMIRLRGTAEECAAAAVLISSVLDVHDTSRPYPDRPPSRLARVYLTTALPADGGPDQGSGSAS